MGSEDIKFTCECFKQLFMKQNRIAVEEEERIVPLTCVDCGMKFYCERHFDLHKTIHNPPESPRKFKSKLKSYIKVSSVKSLAPEFNNRSVACDICNKLLTTRGALKNHMRSHSVKYSCDVCGDGFSAEEAYNRHMRMHEKGKVYNCGICDKDFRRPKNLYRHIQMHSQSLVE